MKKLIALIIALITAVLLLASCGNEPETTTTATTTGGTTPEPEESKIYYASAAYHRVTETPTRVLLAGLKTYYYSKVDGESYAFCFDPLCDHRSNTCVSRLFRSSSLTGQTVYCEYDNRLYFARSEMIYSTSFDASDLRLDCKLGEAGGLDDANVNSNYIKYLRSYDKYVFFTFANSKTGHNQMLRYDVSTKKLEEMTSAEDEWITFFEIADGYVYFSMLGSDKIERFYTADMNFENRKVINNPLRNFSAVDNGIYDGKRFYAKTSEGLVAFDPLKDEREVISEDEMFKNFAQIMAVNKYGIYFTLLYSSNPDSGLPSTDEGYVIYRFSFDGKIEEVCDFRDGVIQEINFVEGGAVVLYPSIYFKNESGERVEDPAANGAYVHYELDENGRFVNPKPIGESASNEKLVEFFKEFNAFHGDPEVVTTEESTTATVATTETASTTETAETTETAATTATAATELTTEETTATEETTVGTTASTIDVTTLPIVGDYTNLHEQIPFKGVAPVSKYYQDIVQNVDRTYIYQGRMSIGGMSRDDFYIVTIAGYDKQKSATASTDEDISYYYVYAAKYGVGLVDDTVYEMSVRGSPSNPMYGQDRFEIGQQFLVVPSKALNQENRIVNGTVLRWLIEEVDGETYVYGSPMYYEFKKLKCAEKITDEYENLVYKSGIDDDIIADLNAKGLSNPTHDYKCKLDDFIEEMCVPTLVFYPNSENPVTPVGEYTSIREQVPFESFAELPEGVDLSINLDDYYKYQNQANIIAVMIAGYIGEEIGDDGIVYSYYYVYADVNYMKLGSNLNETVQYSCRDNTVYVMKAYGSPAHPYYGQQRYEIGDILLRLETDLEYLRSEDHFLDATFLFYRPRNVNVTFYVPFSDYPLIYMDFNMYSATCPIFKQDTIPAYDPEYDADIVAYMEANGIEAPMVLYFENAIYIFNMYLSGHMGLGSWNVNDGRH